MKLWRACGGVVFRCWLGCWAWSSAAGQPDHEQPASSLDMIEALDAFSQQEKEEVPSVGTEEDLLRPGTPEPLQVVPAPAPRLPPDPPAAGVVAHRGPPVPGEFQRARVLLGLGGSEFFGEADLIFHLWGPAELSVGWLGDSKRAGAGTGYRYSSVHGPVVKGGAGLRLFGSVEARAQAGLAYLNPQFSGPRDGELGEPVSGVSPFVTLYGRAGFGFRVSSSWELFFDFVYIGELGRAQDQTQSGGHAPISRSQVGFAFLL